MEHHDMASILSKINTPDGARLIELMKKDGGATFLKASVAAKAGDYQRAKELLIPLLENTNAEILARKIANGDG